MHLFILSFLLNAVSNLVFATTEEMSHSNQSTTSMSIPEGANVTLNCTFDQSVMCTWKRKNNLFCIDGVRFRFVYESRNEMPCNNSDDCTDHCSFQYKDCSIHLLNYTNNIDRSILECIGVATGSENYEGIVGGRFEFISAASNDKSDSTNEPHNKKIYVYVAVGGALLLLAVVVVVTTVCLMKRKRNTRPSAEDPSESTNKNESSSVNVTLNTSGLSEEALVLMRKPQPNPRGLSPKRKSASTGCINPYAEIHFPSPSRAGTTQTLHASNAALASGYSAQEGCYSNLYDDVAVNRNNLHDIVPPSTQYDVNHYAIPDTNNAILPKVPPNSEVVYAEIQISHKSRRLNPSN